MLWHCTPRWVPQPEYKWMFLLLFPNIFCSWLSLLEQQFLAAETGLISSRVDYTLYGFLSHFFFLSLSNDVLWINTPVGDVLGRSSAAVNAGEIPPPTRPGIKLQKQLLDIKILLKHQRFTNCEYTTHARQEAFKHSILSLRLHVSSSPASYEAPLNFTNYALLSGFQPQTTT